MIAIPNFSPKDGLYYIGNGRIHKYKGKGGTVRVYDLIEIDLVRCGECKHKPIKYDPEGDEFGFNLVSPNGYDNLCPCLNTDDGFYSYMPDDNFFCAYGERRADDSRRTD